MLLQHADDFIHLPKPIRDARRHCWRRAQGLMDAHKIVIHEMQQVARMERQRNPGSPARNRSRIPLTLHAGYISEARPITGPAFRMAGA